jgi:hypothetical protein
MVGPSFSVAFGNKNGKTTRTKNNKQNDEKNNRKKNGKFSPPPKYNSACVKYEKDR